MDKWMKWQYTIIAIGLILLIGVYTLTHSDSGEGGISTAAMLTPTPVIER